MFTESDQAFLAKLGQQAEHRLASADPMHDRLHHAIDDLRASLSSAPDIDAASRDQVGDLLDAVWWASTAGDRPRARALASALTRTIRTLDLSGLAAMRVLDTAQQIRSLVVLAA